MVARSSRLPAAGSFFSSLKLTVTSLLLLAATSIFGTVIPQNLSPSQYHEHYGSLARLLLWLQLDDMYHSVWFTALIGLFLVNLCACSLRRLPTLWRSVFKPPLVADDSLLRTLTQKIRLDSACPMEEVVARLNPYLRRHFGRIRQVRGGELEVCFFGERRRYARFAVYITHLAILVIVLGALIGSWFGFDSFVTLVEGETVTRLAGREGQEAIDLGFELRCDEFSLSYYPGSARPREYRSLLTVIEEGREVPGYVRVPVVVNRPLSYRGLNFFQSSYGLAEMPLFHLQVDLPDGSRQQVASRPGELVVLADGGSLRVVDYTPAFRDLGKAALVEVLTAAGQRLPAIAAMQEIPAEEQLVSPYDLMLLQVDERYYTGLQVTRDPGVPLVWFGFLLLVLGSLSAFSLAHQRLWLSIRSKTEGCEVRIAGRSHRNQEAFARSFKRLGQGLAEELEAQVHPISEDSA